MAPFNFAGLPVELQLEIVRHIASEKDMLLFRLVCSSTNALVLEPDFWREITFSKRRYFKTGHRSDRRPLHLNPPPLSSTTAAGSGASNLHPTTPPTAAFFHNSDANILVHRESFAASVTRDAGYGDLSYPSLFIVRQRPMVTNRLQSSSDTSPPTLRTWATIEDSFLEFISCLASKKQRTHGAHRMTIEDWENTSSMDELWNSLQKFHSLTDLSIRNSALRRLMPSSFPTSPSYSQLGHHDRYHHDVQHPPWEHLVHLDLKDCAKLCDLSGIHALMPNVQSLSLEGCLGIDDFSSLGSLTPGSGGSLITVNLINTKVRDEELIGLLKISPHLQELRLDQCYQLTAASLAAIGYGPGGSDDPELHLQAQQGPVFSTAPSLATAATTTTTATTMTTSLCPQLKVLSLRNCYDLADEGVRALAGCRHLEFLIIRGLRLVDEGTVDWLHAQGVPLRRVLSPLGLWRHWVP